MDKDRSPSEREAKLFAVFDVDLRRLIGQSLAHHLTTVFSALSALAMKSSKSNGASASSGSLAAFMVANALAFQRTGDPDGGEFGDAEIIARFGETPSDRSAF